MLQECDSMLIMEWTSKQEIGSRPATVKEVFSREEGILSSWINLDLKNIGQVVCIVWSVCLVGQRYRQRDLEEGIKIGNWGCKDVVGWWNKQKRDVQKDEEGRSLLKIIKMRIINWTEHILTAIGLIRIVFKGKVKKGRGRKHLTSWTAYNMGCYVKALAWNRKEWRLQWCLETSIWWCYIMSW